MARGDAGVIIRSPRAKGATPRAGQSNIDVLDEALNEGNRTCSQLLRSAGRPYNQDQDQNCGYRKGYLTNARWNASHVTPHFRAF
jgi:hypothetical protein